MSEYLMHSHVDDRKMKNNKLMAAMEIAHTHTHTLIQTPTNTYILTYTTHTQDRSFNFRSVVAIKKSKATKLHSILQILLFLSQFAFPFRLQLLSFFCCIVFSRHLCNVGPILPCPAQIALSTGKKKDLTKATRSPHNELKVKSNKYSIYRIRPP